MTDSTPTVSACDADLLAAFVDCHDEAAFALVVARHAGMVLAICRAVLGNATDAEDAAQAVFLTLAQTGPAAARGKSAGGWLHRVAWYVAARALEARATRERHEHGAAVMRNELESADRQPVSSELLHAGLAELPDKYRVALVLHHLEGRTQQETAALLGLDISAVAMRLNRGRQLLRARLTRRGLTVSAVAVAAALGTQAPAQASAAFLQATAHAAKTVLAGKLAAAGAAGGSVGVGLSAKTLSLSKGALAMLYGTHMKVAAAMVAAILLAGGALGTYLALADTPGPMGWGTTTASGTGADVAPTTPPPITPLVFKKVDPTERQAQALAAKIDASYRRAAPEEWIQDMHRRTGVRILCAQPLRAWGLASVDGAGLTGKETLDKLAAGSSLAADFQADALLLTTPPDKAQGVGELARQLDDKDRWKRCAAVWQLATLSHPDVYAALVKALADPDPGVVEWTLRALERHREVARLWTDPQKEAIATVIIQQVDGALTKARQAARAGGGGMGGGGMGAMGGGTGGLPALVPERAALLGATQRPRAIEALQTWIKPEQPYLLRAAAVRGLAAAGQGHDAILKLFHETRATVLAAHGRYNGIEGAAASTIYQATLQALLEMEDPEALGLAMAAAKNDINAQLNGPVKAALEEIADVQIKAELRLIAIRKFNYFSQTTTATPAAPGVRPGDPAAHQAMLAAQVLSQRGGSSGGSTDDDLWSKLFQDATALQNLASCIDQSGTLHLPADTPALLDLLLSHLQDPNPRVVRLIIRGLGTSHDPKAADALIKLLDDKDPWYRAEAAQALAHTRDPRAVDKLVALLHAKLDWPDAEAEDKALARQNQAFHLRLNPRKYAVLAIPETHDPKALDTLVALFREQELPKELRKLIPELLPGTVWSAADAEHFFAVLKKLPADQVSDVMYASTPMEFRAEPENPLRGSTATAPLWPPAPSWPLDEARWVALLAERLDEAEQDPRDRKYDYHPALDALPGTPNPWATRALFETATGKDAAMARLAKDRLMFIRDPWVMATLQKGR